MRSSSSYKDKCVNKFNKQLLKEMGLVPGTNYIKGQKMQLFGNVMRKKPSE